MDDKDKIVLRKVHRKFVEILDPNYIIDFLFEAGAFSADDCLEIQNIEFRGNRARTFMLYIADMATMTMDLLYDALKENKYEFLAEMLRHSNNSIPIQRKAEFFSRFRKELVLYRHYLKRLSHSGNHQKFEQEFFKAKSNWEAVLSSGLANKRYKEADLYFFALDAWCEYRRVIYDKNLMYSEIFDDLESLRPYTSEENLPEMMRLVRYGSAVLMTDKNELDTALQYVQDAKTKFDLIHACRETGTVLYIEYNMLCQKYAISLEPRLKTLLINIASQAIEHFSREIESDELVFLDFKRMVLLKLSHLHLGIGMFGLHIDVPVTNNDKQKASSLLKRVREDKNCWERMETRWKWSYYTAKAKLFGLHQDFNKAIKHTKKALRYATHGKYSKEMLGSATALEMFENKSLHARPHIGGSVTTFQVRNEYVQDQRSLHALKNEVEYCLNNARTMEGGIDEQIRYHLSQLQMLRNMQNQVNKCKEKIYELKLNIMESNH